MVGGFGQAGLFGKFVIERGFHRVGETPAQSGADGFDSERRAFGDFVREVAGLVAKLVGWGENIGQTPLNGLFAGDPAAGVEHQAGALESDEARERVRKSEARMQAELGEISGEAGFGSGDAEVGAECEAESASDGRALNGGDDWLAGLEKADGLDVEARGAAGFELVALELGGTREVGARAERFALGGENNRAAVV